LIKKGFVGKVLLHKLLTCCDNLPENSIYVLVRGKKNLSAEERFNIDVFQSPIFHSFANLRSKIRVVEGDIGMNRLGLNSEDYQEIADKCTIIIHMAATVNFNEKLVTAIELNTFGPLHILKLGATCKNLKSIVITSTCYVNSNILGAKNDLGEKIYPYPRDPIELVKEISKMTREEVEIFSSKIIEGFPNTYTFTKCMGEHMLAHEKGDLPVSIVRPAIIGPALSYPVPVFSFSI